MGCPYASINSRATGCCGLLIASVGRPPEATAGTFEALPSTSVNGPGHHASAKVSDTAFTSRWNATYTVAYLPAEAETRLLVNAGAPVEEAERAVRCAGMTRSDAASVTQPVVLRQLLAWARACGRGTDPKSAWAWRVMTSTPDHDRPALRELTRTCFDW